MNELLETGPAPGMHDFVCGWVGGGVYLGGGVNRGCGWFQANAQNALFE